MRDLESKFVSYSALGTLAEALHSKRKKIVTTNGCFDLLHWGHMSYLQAARALGDVLICGLNSDSSVKKIKGERRPIFSEVVRSHQLASLECVDYVAIFQDETPVAFLKEVRPAIHVKGGDYRDSEIPERPIVEMLGGKMVFLPFLDGFSSTSILESLDKL